MSFSQESPIADTLVSYWATLISVEPLSDTPNSNLFFFFAILRYFVYKYVLQCFLDIL